jgi:uncharacterized protein YndB with AHSA1/START domain
LGEDDVLPVCFFDAWITQETIGQWWSPRDFSTTVHSMEVQTGGLWKYTMHGPDGTNYPNEVRYEANRNTGAHYLFDQRRPGR